MSQTAIATGLTRNRNPSSHNGRNNATSVNAILAPSVVKKSGPIGATGIGRHGAKNRVRLKGHSSAAPRPPSVIVSRRPWLASTSVAITIVGSTGRLNHRAPKPTRTPPASANTSECVAPRCPHGALYGTPRMKPTTSMSGKSERADQNSSEGQRDARPSSSDRDAVRPTATWPTLATYGSTVRRMADTTVSL